MPLPPHPLVGASARPVLRYKGEIQPWKIYENHVRDQFYVPNQSIKRTQSAAEIGPDILLQDVYPNDLTTSFGGRVRLRDQYVLRKRIPNSVGYLDRTYVDAKADVYPASRFYDIVREPDFHQTSTDDYFHMYRPWRVHLPPTYASTWQMRYEKGMRNKLGVTAALMDVRRRDHTVEVMSGDYATPTYWKQRFGDQGYVKNPWQLSAVYYDRSHKGY